MPADTPTTLTFDNQDAGMPHNFAVFKDAAYTENVFTGDIVTGPATQSTTTCPRSRPAPTTSSATSTPR